MFEAAATTPATSTEAHAAPVAPQDAPPASSSPSEAIVTKDGVPLTAGASIEDLLRADPIPPAKPVIVVPGDSGQSVASLTNGAPTQGQREAEEAAAAAPEPVAAAPEREPVASPEPEDAVEPEAPALDEEAAIARLTQQKLDLLRTQGRKNQELGDLRQEVRQLREAMQQVPPPPAAPAWQNAPQMDPADLAARLLDNPAAVIPALVEPLVMRRAQEIAQQVLAQQAQSWQEQQAFEQSAIAPEVGKDLFMARHGIKQDFDTWVSSTDEGKAVNSLFERDQNRARLLAAYREDGDPRGIADTLSNALQAHRIGKKAAQGRQTIAQERARIDAAHPASAPVRPATAPPSLPRAKDLYSKDFTEADLMEFMKGAQQFDRDA